MTTRNKTRYAILGALSHGPRSGYDIKKFLEDNVGYFWSESYAQIYPMLKKLVVEESAHYKGDEHIGGRARSMYEITDKGQAELKDWLQSSTSLPQYRIEILLKLFFGWNADKKVSIENIKDIKAQTLMLQREYERDMKRIDSEKTESNVYPYWLSALNYTKATIDAQLIWCDETLALLED